MAVTQTTNLDYLLDFLRLQIGDIDSTAYRYLDEWLRTALVMAIKTSGRWLNNKYLLDTDYNVYRNSDGTLFEFDSPPIIEDRDERVIILLASIITKQGSLESNAWSVGSWKDAEISYSNIESGKELVSSIERDWNELKDIVKIPTKRLAKIIKGSLPGFKENLYETGA